jgi:hypothetical protein
MLSSMSVTTWTVRGPSRVALGLMLVTCAGNPAKPDGPTGASAGDAGAPAPAAAEQEKPVEHPFAGTAQEATSLILASMDKRMRDMWRCVDAKRARTHDAHLKVVVNIGIDQEGTLIGVSALKSTDSDDTLNDCIRTALKRLPWPKSHAGVITVKQEFADRPVYPE